MTHGTYDVILANEVISLLRCVRKEHPDTRISRAEAGVYPGCSGLKYSESDMGLVISAFAVPHRVTSDRLYYVVQIIHAVHPAKTTIAQPNKSRGSIHVRRRIKYEQNLPKKSMSYYLDCLHATNSLLLCYLTIKRYKHGR